jgi:diaminohydroxyphosphoribosylaminopyrimidine deaminase/5-amino-6-(5-phosphoribosylamino)uracil reductase
MIMTNYILVKEASFVTKHNPFLNSFRQNEGNTLLNNYCINFKSSPGEKMDDVAYMKKAIELGRKGLGRTAPNPPVGAVIVKDGRIIGEGFHPKAGMPHAEIYALNSCSENPDGSTLYVTLEPCCHHGKTPPCTDAIIKAGIKRVVYAVNDPNPVVACNGIQTLTNARIEVLSGLCSKEAGELFEWYSKWMKTGLPFVTLKAAMTIDGYIAASNADPKWISSEESRQYVHELRNRMDGVLVGIGTVITDNPLLTCRIDDSRDPMRIIIDKKLEIPSDAKCLGDKCIIITAATIDRPDITNTGAKVIRTVLNKDELFDWQEIFKLLGDMGIHSVLVEGGSSIISSLLKTSTVDKITLFIAPKILGSGIKLVSWDKTSSIDDALNLVIDNVQTIGGDIMIEARLKE